MEVRADRLRSDIESNAKFGAVDAPSGHGRTVLAGSAADGAARDHLVDRMEEVGLSVSVDAVGNVVGRWIPDGVDPETPAVAAGSHLDSVPEGGIFDGPLGVYAALEAVRAIRESDRDLSRPVEVVDLTEEEGQRFGGGLVGSSVAAGDMSVEAALALEDDGETLAEALEDIGYRGMGRLDASGWHAWLELHVEQGTRLETADVPAGVVTSVTGLTRCDVRFEGEADHAGTTPMDERADAFAAASEFVLDVEAAASQRAETSPGAVATVGKATVGPNAPNVVPGTVDVTVDVRDVHADSIDAIVEAARDSATRVGAERPVDVSFARPWSRDPVPMSDTVRETLHAAGGAATVETTDLHSGAAHDTMNIATVTDAGLLFAPSRDGLSHNPEEWTEWSDCAAATRVLAHAIADLAA